MVCKTALECSARDDHRCLPTQVARSMRKTVIKSHAGLRSGPTSITEIHFFGQNGFAFCACFGGPDQARRAACHCIKAGGTADDGGRSLSKASLSAEIIGGRGRRLRSVARSAAITLRLVGRAGALERRGLDQHDVAIGRDRVLTDTTARWRA